MEKFLQFNIENESVGNFIFNNYKLH